MADKPGLACQAGWRTLRRTGCATTCSGQAVDQFVNAATLAGLGGGVQLPAEQVDGESLRAAVEAAAGCAGRAGELRREVRSHGGTAITADAVERLCVPGADT